MNEGNGDAFNEIGDEVTVPEVVGGKVSHEPKHGDDREREGKGDEERHLVVLVEFVNNHQHVDVAEGDETEGEDAQGLVGLTDEVGLVSSKEANNQLRVYPYHHTHHDHRHSDEAERLTNHGLYTFGITLPHLDGSQRLEGLTGA